MIRLRRGLLLCEFPVVGHFGGQVRNLQDNPVAHVVVHLIVPLCLLRQVLAINLPVMTQLLLPLFLLQQSKSLERVKITAYNNNH